MENISFMNKARIGTPLAEVFSITIDTNDTEKCEIYGTIKIEDCNGSFILYDVSREESESECIARNEMLILTQGKRAICADDGFTMFFDLKEKKRGDVDFISGHFRWDITDVWTKHIVATVPGHFGSSAIVEYAVFDGAIEANIWALFSSEDKNARSTCGLSLEGTIVARYINWNGDLVRDIEVSNKCYEIMLLSDGVCELHDEDLMPLERPFVVLPLGYALAIEVNLNGRDSEGRLATWKGQVKYFPQDVYGNSSYAEITGECGVLKFGCRAFRYLGTLANVEALKKYSRDNGMLLNIIY